MEVSRPKPRSKDAEVKLLMYEADFYKTCNTVRQNGVELHQLKSYLLNELLELEKNKRFKMKEYAENTIEALQVSKEKLSEELQLIRLELEKFQLSSVSKSEHHKEKDIALPTVPSNPSAMAVQEEAVSESESTHPHSATKKGDSPSPSQTVETELTKPNPSQSKNLIQAGGAKSDEAGNGKTKVEKRKPGRPKKINSKPSMSSTVCPSDAAKECAAQLKASDEGLQVDNGDVSKSEECKIEDNKPGHPKKAITSAKSKEGNEQLSKLVAFERDEQIDDLSNPLGNEQVKKRKRGRPKKTNIKSKEEKKQPSTLIASETDEQAKKDLSSHLESSEQVKKRKPGRPKKTSTKSEGRKQPSKPVASDKDEQVDLSSHLESNKQVKKRKPGCPKKTQTKSQSGQRSDEARVSDYQTTRLKPSGQANPSEELTVIPTSNSVKISERVDEAQKHGHPKKTGTQTRLETSDNSGQFEDNGDEKLKNKEDKMDVVKQEEPGRHAKAQNEAVKSPLMSTSTGSREDVTQHKPADYTVQLSGSSLEQSKKVVQTQPEIPKRRAGRPLRINRTRLKSLSSSNDDETHAAELSTEAESNGGISLDKQKPKPGQLKKIEIDSNSTNDIEEGLAHSRPEPRKPGRPRKRKPEEPVGGVVVKKACTHSSDEAQQKHPQLPTARDQELPSKPHEKPKSKKKKQFLLSQRKIQRHPAPKKSSPAKNDPELTAKEEVEAQAVDTQVAKTLEATEKPMVVVKNGVDLIKTVAGNHDQLASERSRSPEIPLQNTSSSSFSVTLAGERQPSENKQGKPTKELRVMAEENATQADKLSSLDNPHMDGGDDDGSSKDGAVESVGASSFAALRVEIAPTDPTGDEATTPEPTASGAESDLGMETAIPVARTKTTNTMENVPLGSDASQQKAKTFMSKMNSQRTQGLKKLPGVLPLRSTANGAFADASILPPQKKRKTLLSSNASHVSALQLSVVDNKEVPNRKTSIRVNTSSFKSLKLRNT